MNDPITNESLRGEQDVRVRSAWILLAALLLLAVMMAPFALGRVYTADDLGAFHLPLRAFYSSTLAQDQPSDWMPGLFGGFYLTGEGQAGTYHPLHQLLYRVLPLSAAFDFECLLSYPLLMMGMVLLLLRWVRADAALFGALAFTFCGFNLLHFVHPNAVAVVAHIPWLLWAIDVVLRGVAKSDSGWTLLFAKLTITLGTASQLLLGYPQYVWFSLLAELAYCAFLIGIKNTEYRPAHGPQSARLNGTLVRLGWFLFLGVLIGGVQLLPTADALAHSARQSADTSFAASGSLHPLNLVQLVAPYLFESRVVGQNTHELGLYAGAVPFMLCVWLLLDRRRWGALRPLILAAIVLAIAGVFLAMGSYGYLYQLQSYLPGVGKFRFPCRATVLFQLATAVLAAIGFQRLMSDSQYGDTSRRHWIVVAVAMLLAAVAPWVWTDHVAAWPLVLVGPALMAVAALLVTLAAHGSRRACVGLVLLAAADLGVYGLSYSVWGQTDRLAEFAGPRHAPARVAMDLADFQFDQPRIGNRVLLSGLERIDGYAGLFPARQLDYRTFAALKAASVRAVLRTPDNETIVGLTPRDKDWLSVPNTLSYARLVTEAVVSHDPASDIGRIPLETTALIEAPLEQPLESRSIEPGHVHATRTVPGQLDFQVACDSRQLLVVAESFHAGWRAMVDGQTRPVVRANGDFLGCVIEPGRHVVTLRFRPDSLAYGGATTVLGLGLLGLTVAIGWLRSTPRRPAEKQSTNRT